MTQQMDTPVPQPIPTPEHFPVAWQHADDQKKFWTRDRMHFPDQVTVAETELIFRSNDGLTLAFQHFGIPVVNDHRRINTYLYGTASPTLGPEEAAANETHLQARMQEEAAQLQQIWNTDYLPEIQSHLTFWSEFDLSVATPEVLRQHLDETLRRFVRVWELHFRTVIPLYLSIGLFEEMYCELFPTDDVFHAYEMLQGLPNKTTESGVELWRLSRKALSSPEIYKAVTRDSTSEVLDALGQTQEGRAFRAHLDGYLQEYGQRGDKWSPLAVSWIEDPTPALNNLRDYLNQPERDLVAEMQVSAAKREAAIAESRRRLQGYPEPIVKQFDFLLEKAQECNILSEDHGYWIDFRCTHQVRMLLLGIGRHFAASGQVEHVDDIFHLTFDEMSAGLADEELNFRSRVEARKIEMDHWSAVDAPDMVGTLPPGPPPDNPMTRTDAKFFGAPVQPATEPGLIRGHAGSPGVVVGPARIIRSISEADILRAGDILVAETTAPPWTPLFGTVAAVVTDTGGILSHCAVVAREYGIPAVVGTGFASSTLVDGQMLEVNGSEGVVRILDAPANP